MRVPGGGAVRGTALAAAFCALTVPTPPTPPAVLMAATPATAAAARAAPASLTAVPARATPVSAYVYATREGLVGRRTANGHLIVAADHFVSLPSWRSLSAQNSGTYSVRVCSALSRRCAYEPAWDVGPWNTRDDYWNAPRQQWLGLPRGMPEAQAAYQNGYNGGRDQYGRLVRNPAGLDLADGAINQDLALAGGGAWVTVTMLWTGAGTNAQVQSAGGPLRVRGAASTGAPLVGAAARFARLAAACVLSGELVAGYLRTTNRWVRIDPGRYISYAYVALDAGATLAHC